MTYVDKEGTTMLLNQIPTLDLCEMSREIVREIRDGRLTILGQFDRLVIGIVPYEGIEKSKFELANQKIETELNKRSDKHDEIRT